MRNEKEKTIEELFSEFHELNKKSKFSPRKLKSKDGCLLLDPDNQSDVEWYENEDDYDIIRQ